jgi:uncharacterized protein (TIGR03118 family)
MKKLTLSGSLRLLGLLLFSSLVLVNTNCSKGHEAPAEALQDDESSSLTARGGRGNDNDFDFLQVNLTANSATYGATNIDPLLKNGWGIAFSTGGTPWVGSQGGHVSTIYNREGGTQLAPVHISSPGANEGGNPTGVVANALATDFLIPAGNGTTAMGAARFIFVGVDGVVSGWNPTWGNHSYRQFNNSATSSYTGLTIALKDSAQYLYAADFRGGKIQVWDKNWNPVNMSFKDRNLPQGYSPFNIQVIGDWLYVTYAKVGRDGRSEAGKGKGLVNIFTTSGKYVGRFAQLEDLNAPWGIAKAPPTFFPADSSDNGRHGNHAPKPVILIGNFGDGKINVYSLLGEYQGQLKKNNRTLVIDGLWALVFPPTTSTIDQRRLYFASGPNRELDGVFGYIIQDSTASSGGNGGGNGGGGHHGDY